MTVLEAADRPGGAVRTEELTLPGLPPRHVLLGLPGRRRLAGVRAHAARPRTASVGAPGRLLRAPAARRRRAAVLYRDVDATAASLDAAARRATATRWARSSAPFLEHFDAVRGDDALRLPAARRPAAAAAAPARCATLELRARCCPARRSGSASGCSAPTARARGSTAPPMHGDAPPDGAGSAIAAVLPEPARPRGRLAEPARRRRSADRRARRLPGRARRRDPRPARASSGSTSRGGRVDRRARSRAASSSPPPIVIADVMPHALLRLAATLAGWYRRRCSASVPGPATLKLDWALDGPIPWANRGGPRRRAPSTSAAARTSSLARIAAVGARPAERPFLLLGQQTVADPTRAPAGKHTAWAYTHGPQEASTGRASPTGTSSASRRRSSASRPASATSSSPATCSARRPRGPQPQPRRRRRRRRQLPARQVVFRPAPALSPYRTPLRGLYLGSAATFPGGAVHGVPGDAAAHAALAERERVVTRRSARPG